MSYYLIACGIGTAIAGAALKGCTKSADDATHSVVRQSSTEVVEHLPEEALIEIRKFELRLSRHGSGVDERIIRDAIARAIARCQATEDETEERRHCIEGIKIAAEINSRIDSSVVSSK